MSLIPPDDVAPLLPDDPFTALRVTYGMLLGEDDFRILAGNPRGKQMMHNAWLHGSGVVWGLPVCRRQDVTEGEIAVGPGLAVDGHGRELSLTATEPVCVRAWAREQCALGATNPLTAWLVAEFRACPGEDRPTIADPCDVTRRVTVESRVAEQVRLRLVSTPPRRVLTYRRVRHLLGLPGHLPDGSARAAEVNRVRDRVLAEDPHRRPRALLRAFRELAALDAIELGELLPSDENGVRFPVADPDAAVLLARITLTATTGSGCDRPTQVTIDDIDLTVRRTLLPTATIQELLTGLAPGLLGVPAAGDDGGPRLLPSSLRWRDDDVSFTFRVDRPIAPGSGEKAVQVASLDDDGRGWSDEFCRAVTTVDGDGIELHQPDGTPTVLDGVVLAEHQTQILKVELDSPRRIGYRTFRIVVRGTGPTPLLGDEPRVPFAGEVGGPPGGQKIGHDAVMLSRIEQAAGSEQW
ncbi:hypothetical protein [Actinomycetospora lemnae]|uniref:Uncharacterized protein n=1 Tax=Actinomycetospora lemnae TaxID=3019891 RepID=A0ABT5SRS7_9PSEU|nr:hypothetical protein [Actinomycetospora sp. DW7H6]MDD7965494.1 hypothetical protein [Actinomycetospora sp. DW7H6]